MSRMAFRALQAAGGQGAVHTPATFVNAYEGQSTAVPASGTATIATSSFTPNPGELLVCKTLEWENTLTPATPTGGGLVWTQRVAPLTTASIATAGIWTAVAPASPSAMTVSSVFTNTKTAVGAGAILLERWIGTLAGTPQTANVAGSASLTAAMNSSVSGSAITWAGVDWNGVAVAGTAYVSGAVQTFAPTVVSSGSFTIFNAWQRTSSVGSQTIGMTAPTGQKSTFVGLEILGT